MITVRRATERRHVQRGKQDSWLTFSPQERPGPFTVAFGLLTTIDELQLPPGESSARHHPDEAEILTYVYAGALALEDSTGRSWVIQAGEFQRMTTGLRIRCRVTNASQTDWVLLFQIAMHPPSSNVGLDCAHEQKRFTAAQRHNVLCIVASRDGRKGSLRIQPDALVYSSILDPGRHLVYELLPGRSVWLHIVYGEATLMGINLNQGDGVGLTTEPSVSLTVQQNTEILLLDLGPAPDSIVDGVDSALGAQRDGGDRSGGRNRPTRHPEQR